MTEKKPHGELRRKRSQKRAVVDEAPTQGHAQKEQVAEDTPVAGDPEIASNQRQWTSSAHERQEGVLVRKDKGSKDRGDNEDNEQKKAAEDLPSPGPSPRPRAKQGDERNSQSQQGQQQKPERQRSQKKRTGVKQPPLTSQVQPQEEGAGGLQEDKEGEHEQKARIPHEKEHQAKDVKPKSRHRARDTGEQQLQNQQKRGSGTACPEEEINGCKEEPHADEAQDRDLIADHQEKELGHEGDMDQEKEKKKDDHPVVRRKSSQKKHKEKVEDLTSQGESRTIDLQDNPSPGAARGPARKTRDGAHEQVRPRQAEHEGSADQPGSIVSEKHKDRENPVKSKDASLGPVQRVKSSRRSRAKGVEPETETKAKPAPPQQTEAPASEEQHRSSNAAHPQVSEEPENKASTAGTPSGATRARLQVDRDGSMGSRDARATSRHRESTSRTEPSKDRETVTSSTSCSRDSFAMPSTSTSTTSMPSTFTKSTSMPSSNSERLKAYLERNRDPSQQPARGDVDDTSSVASSARGARDAYTWQAVETGRPGTMQHRTKFRDRLGKTCSPWHNIPLYTRRGHVHVVCVTPKRSWARFELAQDEPYTPIRLSQRDGRPTHFSSNCPWNLTILPQTWANPEQINLDYIGLKYDGKPLELIEIGRKARRRGQVYDVKVLGAFAVVNSTLTQLSWKLLGVAATDKRAKKMDDVKDIHSLMPRVLEEVREWLRSALCILPGDMECVFGLNERAADKQLASALVTQAYMSWQAYARKEKPLEPAFLPPEPDEIVCDVHSGSSTGGSSSDVDGMSLATYDEEVLGPGAIPLYDPSAKLILRLKGASTASVVAYHGSDDEGNGSGGENGSESPGSRATVAVSCSRRELMRYLRSADPRLERPAFVQFLSGEAEGAQLVTGLNKVEERPEEEAAMQFMPSPSVRSLALSKTSGVSVPARGCLGNPSKVRAGGAVLLCSNPGAEGVNGSFSHIPLEEKTTFVAAASAAAAVLAVGQASHGHQRNGRSRLRVVRPVGGGVGSDGDALRCGPSDAALGCLPAVAVSGGGIGMGGAVHRQRSGKEKTPPQERQGFPWPLGPEVVGANEGQFGAVRDTAPTSGLHHGGSAAIGSLPRSPGRAAPMFLMQGRRAVLTQFSRKAAGIASIPLQESVV